MGFNSWLKELNSVVEVTKGLWVSLAVPNIAIRIVEDIGSCEHGNLKSTHFAALRPNVDHNLLVFYVSRSHSLDAPQSVGLIWTGDNPVAETSTWKHTTLTTNIHVFGGIRTHSLFRQAAADLRPKSTLGWINASIYRNCCLKCSVCCVQIVIFLLLKQRKRDPRYIT
jgi:hypothetical protein